MFVLVWGGSKALVFQGHYRTTPQWSKTITVQKKKMNNRCLIINAEKKRDLNLCLDVLYFQWNLKKKKKIIGVSDPGSLDRRMNLSLRAPT